MKRNLKVIIAALLCFALNNYLFAQSYTWKNVKISGGGYVSGLIYSKADPGLLYARTDVGGAYRWNASSKTWAPITDGLTSPDDYGIWSLAPDPVDANKVYIATGLYSASWGSYGVVYGSDDKGNTWTRLADLPFRLGANDPGRGICERLVVDPNRPNILFLGSKMDGLYRSDDSGKNWQKINSFPGSYVTFVEFDAVSGNSGLATPVIYAGVADYIYNKGVVGLYRSMDGGTTWDKLPNHPAALSPKSFAPGNNALATVPVDMAIASNDNIYVAFCNSVTPNGDYDLADPHKSVSNGAVYKFNKTTSQWTNITPANSENLQGGFGSVAVSRQDPDKVVIGTSERWWPADEVYFSADGGANWASTFNSFSYADTWGSSLNKGAYSTEKAPYAASQVSHWITSIVINPANENEVMFGTGMGIYACYNVAGLFTNANANNTASTTWVFENDGIEETVPLELVSPPVGPHLISVIGDFDGFVHTDLDQSPATGRHNTSGVLVGTTYSLAFAENVPAKMVKTHSNNDHVKGSYSLDGGLSWTFFPTQPANNADNPDGGKIAISADGNRIVWSPNKAAMAYSTNNGQSWTTSGGNVPHGLKPVADRVNSLKFYAFDPQGQRFYYSLDGGVNFTGKNMNLPEIPGYMPQQPELRAVFGKEGHVWLANREHGLFFTMDGGATWTKMNVEEAYKVTVGKAASSDGYPAVYIWGGIDGVNGLFRSDDEGNTWVRINDEEHEFGRAHTYLAGDPRIYGRLYLGAGGRGIMYGDPAGPVTSLTNSTQGSDLLVYPNPTAGNVSWDSEKSWELLSTNGLSLAKGFGTGVDLSPYPEGMYFIRLEGKFAKIIKN